MFDILCIGTYYILHSILNRLAVQVLELEYVSGSAASIKCILCKSDNFTDAYRDTKLK